MVVREPWHANGHCPSLGARSETKRTDELERGERTVARGIQRRMLNFTPWATYKLKMRLSVYECHEIDLSR